MTSAIAMTTTGCATLELLAASGMSYLVTGKSLTDNAVSMVLDQDCALHRMIQDEQICAQSIVPEEATAQRSLLAESKPKESATHSKLPTRANETDSQNTLTLAATTSNGTETDFAQPQIFAVVGSFNNYRFAVNRQQKYAQFESYIVPSDSENIAYRVVVGPLQSVSDITSIPSKVGVETADPWLIEMCSNGATVTQCSSGLLAAR
ncbi:MAG: SPOR domain-containing protein [Aestuariibacter sp.]